MSGTSSPARRSCLAPSSEAEKSIIHDSRDFERRLRPQRKRIYNLAYRNLRNIDDAEDVTQETCTRAWIHYASYDPALSFDAWVNRIALNLCVDTIRRRQRQRTVPLDTPSASAPNSEPEGRQVADSTQDPSICVLASELDATLKWAITTLPTPYRRCVQLLQQEYSYEEVAALMSCPVGTVRSRLHRARALIRKRLETTQTGSAGSSRDTLYVDGGAHFGRW